MDKPTKPEEFVRVRNGCVELQLDGRWLVMLPSAALIREVIGAASDLAVKQDRDARGREPCSRCGRWLTPLRVWNDPVCVACFDATIINESLIRDTTEDSPDAEGVTQ